MIDRRLLLAVTVLGAALVLVLVVASGGFETNWGFPGVYLVWAVAFGSMGYVIDRSQPGHPVGRKLLWVGPLAVLNQVASELVSLDADWVGYVVPLLGLWAVYLSLMLHALAVFPDGEWVAPWSRLSVALMWASATVTFVLFNVGTSQSPGGQASPYFVSELGPLVDASFVFWNVMTVAVAAGVLWGFIRSKGVVRRQFSWLAFAASCAAVAALVAAVSGSPVLDAIAAASVAFIPVAMAIAVTRYRLYEIDRIVSRTVSYAVTVMVLSGLYAVVVIGSRSVFGVEGEWPVALWTLVAAFALFPLARRVQGWVDRRFFRSRYDSASVVGAFADELRVTVDPESLVERTESVVGATFQAETVAVWLAEEPA